MKKIKIDSQNIRTEILWIASSIRCNYLLSVNQGKKVCKNKYSYIIFYYHHKHITYKTDRQTTDRWGSVHLLFWMFFLKKCILHFIWLLCALRPYCSASHSFQNRFCGREATVYSKKTLKKCPSVLSCPMTGSRDLNKVKHLAATEAARALGVSGDREQN